MEANYFARLGRRLIAQADAGQVVDFKDPANPTQFLGSSFGSLSKQLRAGVSTVTPLPFFEDQMGAAAQATYGTDCGGVSLLFGFPLPEPNCTQFLADALGTLVFRGDLSDALFQLNGVGLIPQGVGLNPQFATNAYITNKSFSSYNGLLATSHKRLSHNLQFDVNYTYSHSIDNVSAPANNVFGSANFAGGLIAMLPTCVCAGAIRTSTSLTILGLPESTSCPWVAGKGSPAKFQAGPIN